MDRFSNSDKYQMLECFILCGRNDELAAEMYLDRYPERRQPEKSIFRRLRDNLINNGSFVKPKGRRRNENNENIVLQAVVENPRTSLREIENTLGVARSTAGSILKRAKFKPYRERASQGLQNGDEIRRTQFCHWFIEKHIVNPYFFKKILWSDESRFTNCGMFNRKNTIFWSDENPHLVRGIRQQVRWGFNVWISVIDTHVIGPFFFNENLNSERYLELLLTHIAEGIEELPLATCQNMYFQQDGAPPHNALLVTNYLNNEYHNNWIGNRGPIGWPARSPDLTPLDFFVWGHLKNKVYSRSYESVEELRQAVEEAVNGMTPDMVRQSCEAVLTRCRLCVRMNGGLFEQWLH